MVGNKSIKFKPGMMIREPCGR